MKEIQKRLGDAAAALRRQDTAAAGMALDDLIRLNPQVPQVRAAMAQMAMAVERYALAASQLEPLHAAAPSDAGLAAALARALAQDLRPGKAIEILRAALAHNPQSEELHAALAGLLAEKSSYVEAEQHYARAAEINPASSGLLADWGHALRALGKLDEAGAAYRRALALKPDLLTARYGLSMLSKAQAGDPAFKALEWAAVSQSHNPSDTSILHDILSKMYLDVGDGAAAFRHVEAANTIRALLLSRSGKGFDARRAQAVIALAEKTKPQSASPTPRLMLLSGLPRAGKSLLEQRLTQHSQIRAGGEISALRWMAHRLGLFQNNFAALDPAQITAARAQFYVEEIGTGSETFITDAGVGNAELLPLTPLFFPNAVIVHVSRNRDDHATAMYVRPFGNAYYAFATTPEGLRYALDEQDEILATCQRLNIAVHHIQFENLVADPKRIVGDILKACGLEAQDQDGNLPALPETFGPVESLGVAAHFDTKHVAITQLYQPAAQPFLDIVNGRPQNQTTRWVDELWASLKKRPLTVHDLAVFAQLEDALAKSPQHAALSQLHRRVAAIWARHGQAFGDMGLYYQSFDKVLLPGHRDTDVRFAAYNLAPVLKPGMQVLDVGCNTGFIGMKCAESGARLEGFDIDPHLIDIAKDVAAFLNIPAVFKASDFRAFTPSAAPDVILSCAVHRWIGIPIATYAGILKSWLKPGGYLFVESQGVRDPAVIEPNFDDRINEFAAAGFEALSSGEVCDDGISLRKFVLFRKL